MNDWKTIRPKTKSLRKPSIKKIRFHKAMNKPISKNLFKDFANNRKKTYWLVFSHIRLCNILKYKISPNRY